MLKTLSRIGSFAMAASLVGTAAARDASAGEARSCSVPHSDAAVIYAAPAESPLISMLRGDVRTTVVKIDLLPNGAISAAGIAQSSGNAYLDKAALKATRESSFRAETHNCEAVAGSYLFAVRFE